MRLITWNVQWFCGLDDRIDLARIVARAGAMADFDVLCLQEVAANYPRLTGDAGIGPLAGIARPRMKLLRRCTAPPVPARANQRHRVRFKDDTVQLRI